MRPADLALDAVAEAARARRHESIVRWENATGRSDGTAADRLGRAGRLTVNFHPDRIASSGMSVAEGLAASGRYVSQWTTGISNGGRSAFVGGARHRWEHELFGGAYDRVDPADVAFPIYGAWDLLGDPHGGSPRFGSTFLVLADHVRQRTTWCVGDSHVGPTDLSTVDEPWSLLAGLAEQARIGCLLGRPLGSGELLAALGGTFSSSAPSRDLDGYAEAQAHGGIDLGADVESIVLDPSFRATPVEQHLTEAADRYDCSLEWHVGSELDGSDVPDDFRGPTMPALGRAVARPDGVIDAHAIGRAARAIVHGEMQVDGDPEGSPAQELKRLWHVVLAFGHDAEPAPT